MNPRVRLYIAIILSIIVIISILPFLMIFRTQNISKNFKDWADAATWFSLFVGLITNAILVYLSWRIHENETKRDKQSQDILMNLEKPTLIFHSKKGNKNIDEWYIKNIGRGAALNVAITHFPINGNQWIYHLVDCYSLAANESLQLRWLNKTQVNKLIAIYNDNLTDMKHISVGFADRTEIRNTFDFRIVKDDYDNVILSQSELKMVLESTHKRMRLAIDETYPSGQYTLS